MTGTPTRVAVQLGSATVRVAGAEADGPPWLVAELAAPGLGLSAMLADLVGPPPDELVVVHPARWSPAAVSAVARDAAGLAGQVRTAAAPYAAAGARPVAVLDVGHSGAEATLLGAAGEVLACRAVAVGGATLDDAAAGLIRGGAAGQAEVRRLREALSLRPATGDTPVTAELLRPALAGVLDGAVAALRAVLERAGPVPVLLVGGVARTPLLAELVDEAGIPGVAVAPRPDLAAVLGALMLPSSAAPGARPVPVPPRSLAPLPPPRRLRAALLVAAAAVLVAGLLAAGAALPRPPATGAVSAGVLVQFGYRLDVPAGWEHTGGLPERRRSLLTPSEAPEGSDLIAVERTPLGYDAGAEPERAAAELRAEFDAAVAGGSALSDFDPDVVVAGRTVTGYRQHDATTVVEWFVVLDGDAQLSVGCRYTPTRADAVRSACAVVVESVRPA